MLDSEWNTEPTLWLCNRGCQGHQGLGANLSVDLSCGGAAAPHTPLPPAGSLTATRKSAAQGAAARSAAARNVAAQKAAAKKTFRAFSR